jgi:YVTN family beta-propeller protein
MADLFVPTNAPTDRLSAPVEPDLIVLGSVAVRQGPIGDIAVNSDGTTLAVTNFGANSVSLIDTAHLTVSATVAVSGEPFAAAVADDRAYVSTGAASYDSVSVIDTVTESVTATHPLAFTITGVAAAPDGKHVFVSRTARDHVDLAVIDTTSDRVDTIVIATGAGITADALQVSPDGLRVYVATSDAYGGGLVVVDVEACRVVRTVPIGSPIRDLALSPDGAVAYVLGYDHVTGGVVDVLDTTTDDIAARIALGGSPIQVTLSANGTRAFVVDHDEVAVVCTITNVFVDSITVGAQPSSVAASPDGARLYVADYAGVITAFAGASSELYQVMEMDFATAPV